MTSTSPVMNAHAPVATAPTPEINAYAEEDDAPLSYVFRIAASYNRLDESINFHPNPYNCFVLHWFMCPFMLHFFYVKYELTTMFMSSSDMWH